MRAKSKEGRQWIRARCLEGAEDEIITWVDELNRCGFCVLLRALDAEGNIQERCMEHLIALLNFLTAISDRRKDAWLELQSAELLQQLCSESIDPQMIPEGFCKEVASQVIKLTDRLRRDRLPPSLPKSLVRYAGLRQVESLYPVREFMPALLRSELERLETTWEANKDTAWATECMDQTVIYLESMPPPLYSAVFIYLPGKIDGVPIHPFSVLTVAYDGDGFRRPNVEARRIFSVVGLIDHDGNPISDGYIDVTVSRVNAVLRLLAKASFFRFFEAISKESKSEIYKQIHKFLEELAVENKPKNYNKIQQLIEMLLDKDLPQSPEENKSTSFLEEHLVQLLCEEYIPEAKVKLFGRLLIVLANEIKSRMPAIPARAEKGGES